MKQIICDKCKKILEKPWLFKLVQTNSYINMPNRKYHLCDDCYEEFMKFLTTSRD